MPGTRGRGRLVRWRLETAVILNKRGYEHAKKLVDQRAVVLDQRDAWSEHQPSTKQENDYIAQHGIGEYARWHLGVDDEVDEDKKGHYRFPYGDFERVHRCAVLTAESRAGQYEHYDIEVAAAHLHGALDALM
ncbi:MAG TPA: hypothetical protein VEL73_07625 [Mycobacteriales bacterium]|nr:hypothetical protein [Mycobacteriales bacterium]